MPATVKFKVWWDEKEGIIRNKAWGDFNKKNDFFGSAFGQGFGGGSTSRKD